jgi:signal transduction histidine kinase
MGVYDAGLAGLIMSAPGAGRPVDGETDRDVQALDRASGAIHARWRAASDYLEAVLLPSPAGVGEQTNEDFRRIILVVATIAIGFFIPSLPLAGVPVALWLPFILASVAAAVWISASFLFVRRRQTLLACVAAATNALIVAGLGVAFHDYYHEIVLLYLLLVAGHAVVHGLAPAMVTVVLGPAIVPYLLQDAAAANLTDPVYTLVYLTGTALIPWTGWRLAQRRAQALSGLRRSSETERSRLAAILASMSDAVVAVDADGDVVMTNEAFDRRFAWIFAKTTIDDDRGRALPERRWPFKRAARGESFRMTLSARRRDGDRRWFEATGEPISSETSLAGGVVVIRDITDRSLRRLQEEFMATASHELRTPVAALHGYLQLLERHIDPESSATSAKYARSALAQTRRVGQLLDRLFDLARIQTGGLDVNVERADLVSLVRAAVDSASTVSPNRNIQLGAPPRRPLTVLVDPGRFEEVLLNLLTNAITHAPTSPAIEVTVARERDHARVTVRDEGPGIPAAQLAELFTRFSRASGRNGRARKGLGLGLFISRELMRAQGGSIEIASVEGSGTTATLRVRLAGTSRTADRPGAPIATAGRGIPARDEASERVSPLSGHRGGT